MNKDEFNLDTSAEIIDYIQSINIVYKDKFSSSSNLVFPNQFYGEKRLTPNLLKILLYKYVTLLLTLKIYIIQK